MNLKKELEEMKRIADKIITEGKHYDDAETTIVNPNRKFIAGIVVNGFLTRHSLEQLVKKFGFPIQYSTGGLMFYLIP